MAEASLYPELFLARVISQSRELYRIALEGGEGLAEVSGRFRHETVWEADFPAVGDFVMVDREDTRSGHAIIHRVLTRKSVFQRPAVGGAGQMQVVASNVDVLFLCMSLNNDYNLNRLERYLAVAWDSGATPVVVLTKSDLCADLPAVLREIEGVAIGVEVVVTSSLDGESVTRLLPWLPAGATASLLGSSGVGKSTLVNLLAGEALLATSGIRGDDRGRHTTTRRELLVLPGGGIVIDTPGMRELGVDCADLDRSFADIGELAAQCRFRDCTHESEPGCAVLAAVEDGRLDQRRLDNYRKLEKAAGYDGLSAREIEARKIQSMFGGMGELKQARDMFKQKNRRKGR